MALNPNTRYPANSAAPTGGYPYGSARDVSVPGDNTGTPWQQDLINDIWGFLQALLDQASIVPSNSPDEVGASQYLDSINAKYMKLAAGTVGNLYTIGALGQPVPSATALATILKDLKIVSDWNAATNTPDITTATEGQVFVVTVAGTTSLGGIASWNINDWAVKRSGAAWAKVNNAQATTQNILFADLKAQGTPAQTLTNGIWNVRDLAATSNTITGASVGGNVITLPTGTYEIRNTWSGSDFACGNKLRLQNTTTATTVVVGNYADSGSATQASSTPLLPPTRFTVAAATENFQVEHYFIQGNPANPTAGRTGSIIGAQECYLGGEIVKIA